MFIRGSIPCPRSAALPSGNPSLWASYEELLPALHGKSLEALANQFQSRADIQALQDVEPKMPWKNWEKPWENGEKPMEKHGSTPLKMAVSPVEISMKSAPFSGFEAFFLCGKHGSCLFVAMKDEEFL